MSVYVFPASRYKMRSFSSLLFGLSILSVVFRVHLPEKQFFNLPSTITNQSHIESIAAGLESDAAIPGAVASIVIDIVEAIVPSLAPVSIPHSISDVASI